MEIGIYRDENNIERVNADFPDIGQYKIEVSKVIEQGRACDMSHNLNKMPSNTDIDMFSVFKVDENIPNGKNPDIPGYVVKRKVIVGDKVQFFDKLNVVRVKRGEKIWQKNTIIQI